jgi:RHH-type proline utilization regulon transcriptional repressor/proline dehydrogenase/delta 1-pyrroline-5-carboxylate dehydrogenase
LSTTRAADVEALTQAYGREIFARAEAHDGVLPFGPDWWDARLMELTMGNPALQVQLFRFIDALPLLHTPAQVNRHLAEYLGAAGPKLPAWVRRGLPWLPTDDGVLGRLLARTARRHAERFGRRFIAGTNIDEALHTIRQLRRRKLAFTVDLLG